MKSKLQTFKVLLSILVLLLLNVIVTAQTTITGKVTAIKEGLLPGVSIKVGETPQGTITNINGEYKVNVGKAGKTLIFSFIGYKTVEIAIDGRTEIDVVLQEDAANLDEVVVIGYGTQKKKEISGAVVQLKSEEIENYVTSDLSSALQGRIAGVNVTASSGEPGANANIQIRGVTTLNGSNTPLFVVDGIPQNGDPRLAVNEIETIDVLKDAASAAVYGTRGSAGVILITTKRGTQGKAKISFTQSYGIQKINKGVPLMNGPEQILYDSLKYKYVPGSFVPVTTTRPEWATNNTDLRDFVQNDGAKSQSYNLNITGGAKEFNYSVAGGFFQQEGILVNSDFKRYNIRINTGYTKNKLDIRAIVAGSNEDNNQIDGSLYLYGIRYKPYLPSVDVNSTNFETIAGGSQTQTDDLIRRLKSVNNSQRDAMNASLTASYSFTRDLKFTTNLGAGIINLRQKNFVPFYTTTDVSTGISEVDPTKSISSLSNSRSRNYSIDGGLYYKKTIGSHTIGATALVSSDERSFDSFFAGKQGVINNSVQVIDGATINPIATSSLGQPNFVAKTIGILGRVQYSLKDKYNLSASIRRDGSSKFAPENRWGVFPSVSASWNVSQESFWNTIEKAIPMVKIRASYGTTGNESFPAYSYSSNVSTGADYIFGPGVGNVLFGTTVRSYANNLVKWETSLQSNIGLDLGFFDNKLTITADYYNTKKQDMLFPLQLPGSSGTLSGGNANLILNIGNMTNNGLELAANYRLSNKTARLDITGTFSKNTNRVTKINSTTELIYNSNSASIVGDPQSIVSTIAIGHEVGAFYLHRNAGVIKDQATLDTYKKLVSTAVLGDLIYTDTNGDGQITNLDRVYMGSGLPDFEAGLNLTLYYKNFDLGTQWYSAIGHEIMNGSKAIAYSFERHADLLNMWSPINTASNIPTHRGQSKDQANYAGTTDYWLEDGSYVRLRLLSLGYTLPQKLFSKKGISKARVYATAQNVLTFTKYTGFDPEVGGNNVAQRGLDLGRYPLSKQILFGIQLDF